MNDKKFIIYIFLFLVLTFFLFIPGTVGGDALSSYINTENLVKHFSLTIHPDIAEKYNLEDGSGRELEFNSKTGQPYIAYGILNSIVMLPFYLLGMLISIILYALPPDFIIKFCVNISGCLIGALTGVFLFLLLQKLGFDKKINFLMILIYSFCTISFNYTVSTFGESIIAFLLIAAFYYVYEYKLTSRVPYLILSAALLGLAPMGKFSNAVLIIPFLVYLFCVNCYPQKSSTEIVGAYCNTPLQIKIKNIIIYGLIFGIFIFILFWVNYIKTGIFPSAGYAASQSRAPSLANIPAAIAGFLVSPERSIFLFNLPLVLSLIYFKKFFKNFKDEAVLIVFLFVINILAYGVFVFWHGGICWGSRYLVPVIPLLILPCAYAVTENRGQRTEDRNCSKQNTTKNKTSSRGAFLSRPKRREARVKMVLIVLILLSFIIQLNSVMFSWYKLDNVINTDKYFYSVKYSQIPRSFYVAGAYFYKKISGKDMYMTIDGKKLNISKLAKVSPWPLRALKGRIISDSGEVIILNKKIMFAVYFFFSIILLLYVLILNRLRIEIYKM